MSRIRSFIAIMCMSLAVVLFVYLGIRQWGEDDHLTQVLFFKKHWVAELVMIGSVVAAVFVSDWRGGK